MKKYLQIINIRTFQVLMISFVTSFLVIRYNFQYNFDLTVISIAIIFPLVFTIRAAFRRREKALDHLSKFKAAMQILYYCFQRSKKIDDAKKAQVTGLLVQISDSLMEHLEKHDHDQTDLNAKLDAVFQFIQAHKEEISTSEAFKIFRFLKDVHSTIENSIAIDTHRTPISLRAYCQIFIYFFPIIYTPSLLHRMGHESADWVVYVLSMVTGFILISLFNVQDQMENPYDQQGLDDIRLAEFKFKV
ncbi:MAG TPA: hypothetical protein VG737_08280 [Cyclobacteriaceae bacterium]|nr:hypothetical protein [Cyclobacteriaceae bacterium]